MEAGPFSLLPCLQRPESLLVVGRGETASPVIVRCNKLFENDLLIFVQVNPCQNSCITFYLYSHNYIMVIMVYNFQFLEISKFYTAWLSNYLSIKEIPSDILSVMLLL